MAQTTGDEGTNANYDRWEYCIQQCACMHVGYRSEVILYLLKDHVRTLQEHHVNQIPVFPNVWSVYP